MAYILVQHKIGKWAEFEAIFKDEETRRRMLGSKSGAVFRSVDDPQSIFSIHEWDSLEGAKKFVDGLETHEAMEWASSGISSQVYIIEKVLGTEA
jgi:heme-degrading monooxygenase HmoA